MQDVGPGDRGGRDVAQLSWDRDGEPRRRNGSPRSGPTVARTDQRWRAWRPASRTSRAQRCQEPKTQRAREDGWVRGGGQREQITVERSKCEFDAMARKEGTKEQGGYQDTSQTSHIVSQDQDQYFCNDIVLMCYLVLRSVLSCRRRAGVWFNYFSPDLESVTRHSLTLLRTHCCV